ncbi:MAG TPA: M23 family metallopeptidase [Bdellovibrionota bacterium]|jgi:murein DD-endopeptidase MepM/ murein hydrolase activator NlpD|nr:M23 family metallopeptidase [Bdellovibrionota bacterium]
MQRRFTDALLLGVSTVLVLTTSSCATLQKVVRASQDSTLNKLVDDVPISPGLRQKLDMYRKYSAKFERFHDSGNLVEDDVLDVLRDTGVIQGKAGGKPGVPPSKQVRPPVQAYSGGYRWPLDAGVVSSEFGGRWGKEHKGVDVAADMGEPVKASANGVVIYSGNGMRGYGNVIIVRHDNQVTTLYAHNSRLLKVVGQQVKGGETISLLGSTGHSTGPHVHFEIRDGEVAVNPRTRLNPAPYALIESEPETPKLAQSPRQ